MTEAEEQRQQEEQNAERPPSESMLFVGNLKYETTEDVLREAFEKFGKIKELRIVKRRDGKSKGFGFVEYETKEEANTAIEQMNGKELEGRSLLVNISDPEKGKKRHEGRDERRDRYGDRYHGRYRDDDRDHYRDDRRRGYPRYEDDRYDDRRSRRYDDRRSRRYDD